MAEASELNNENEITRAPFKLLPQITRPRQTIHYGLLNRKNRFPVGGVTVMLFVPLLVVTV